MDIRKRTDHKGGDEVGSEILYRDSDGVPDIFFLTHLNQSLRFWIVPPEQRAQTNTYGTQNRAFTPQAQERADISNQDLFGV